MQKRTRNTRISQESSLIRLHDYKDYGLSKGQRVCLAPSVAMDAFYSHFSSRLGRSFNIDCCLPPRWDSNRILPGSQQHPINNKTYHLSSMLTMPCQMPRAISLSVAFGSL